MSLKHRIGRLRWAVKKKSDWDYPLNPRDGRPVIGNAPRSYRNSRHRAYWYHSSSCPLNIRGSPRLLLQCCLPMGNQYSSSQHPTIIYPVYINSDTQKTANFCRYRYSDPDNFDQEDCKVHWKDISILADNTVPRPIPRSMGRRWAMDCRLGSSSFVLTR